MLAHGIPIIVKPNQKGISFATDVCRSFPSRERALVVLAPEVNTIYHVIVFPMRVIMLVYESPSRVKGNVSLHQGQ